MVLSVPSAPGHVRLLSRGIEMAFRPGQLLILTSTVPAELTVDRVCETVQLNIPFSALGHDVHSVVRTLQPVATGSVLVRTTALFIRRFVQAGSTAVADGDVAAQQGIVGLVNALLRQQSYRAHRLDDNTLAVRERTTELIELHYRDPEFDASRVADELHMSRRQLYRHFAQAGESLADMIARRRLEEVRSAGRATRDGSRGGCARGRFLVGLDDAQPLSRGVRHGAHRIPKWSTGFVARYDVAAGGRQRRARGLAQPMNGVAVLGSGRCVMTGTSHGAQRRIVAAPTGCR